ncbi:MAG: fasciclin domain-containing protein [Sphingomonas sp.]
MKSALKISFAAAALTLSATALVAGGKNPIVGGAAMFPTKNIIENAVNSKDHTTLVAAVKAADLVDTLSSAGPFTVFAPTNAAFAKLPAGTVDTLLKPENKGTLSAVLTYHVLPGKVSAAAIAANAKAHGGTATYKTVQGTSLTFKKGARGFTISDAKGHTGLITIADVNQSNGVIHVIDTVMLP